ncbi:MAG: pirin family protein, partial [Saprospiraceae bacterium]|nr:pirin family protein [Saprospiraceae bacterium]
MTQVDIHRADSRGHADHGWLETYHSFSFAQYYNPDRVHFGALRVLNDDKVAGGRGFGRHHHDNMEIISIPLEGGLLHADSMGNEHVIRKNDIQVMSAGSGIFHAEKNVSSTDPVEFLQIWVLPNKRDVEPRYDQITLNADDRKNRWQQILSPDQSGAGVWIYQETWFSLGDFEPGSSGTYELHSPNSGVYLFVLEGRIQFGDIQLGRRDALALTGVNQVD